MVNSRQVPTKAQDNEDSIVLVVYTKYFNAQNCLQLDSNYAMHGKQYLDTVRQHSLNVLRKFCTARVHVDESTAK
jgi:hypothetical protein